MQIMQTVQTTHQTTRHTARARCGAYGIWAVIALLLVALVEPSAVTRAADPAVVSTVTNCNATGAGSLADAVMVAAANTTIAFAQDCTDANTITLPATLEPARTLTIDATTPMHTVTISGGNSVGLFTVNPGITLTLRGLTLTNAALSNRTLGGAIYVAGGTLSVFACTFSSNNATNGEGGAIANIVGGTVNVVGSTFIGNNAPGGGAIANLGTLNIVNATFSGNSATGSGGALYSRLGTMNVVGSTFSGNTARNGGAVFNTGTLALTLSVIAGNNANGGSGPDLYGSVDTDGGGNVVGTTNGSTGLTGSSNKLNTDPLLAPLALYSPGMVQTFALQTGSPALDVVACPMDPTTKMPLTTDARGIARPQGMACDAGSSETLAAV